MRNEFEKLVSDVKDLEGNVYFDFDVLTEILEISKSRNVDLFVATNIYRNEVLCRSDDADAELTAFVNFINAYGVSLVGVILGGRR